MRSERLISITWFCFGKSCLSHAIFNFWILSPNNPFICTVTLMTSFQIPTRTQCKNLFGKQLQFMDFSISPFPEGIRLVTPSKAWYDNSDTCILVTETFLKRFTFPVDNPERKGWRWGGIRTQVYPSDRRNNNLNYLILKQLWRIAKKLSSLSLKQR